MDILKKILTALRGGAREMGEAVVDAQGVRILEQEIHDAKESLEQARSDLADVMAQETQAQRQTQVLKAQLAESEGHVNEALDKGEEGLALELAGKVAEAEGQLAQQEEVATSYAEHVSNLKEMMAEAEHQIAEYERQLSMLKTTESVHKTTEAISDTFTSTNSSVRSAKETLERVKAKQQHSADRLKAAQQLEREANNSELNEKMAAAGIGKQQSDADDVLARIKAGRGN